MCNYITKISVFQYKAYKCNRAIYKNDYCIFHYGLKDNDSNEFNEVEVKQKESDFNYALQVYLNDKNLKEFDFIGWLFPKLNFNNFKLSDQNNFVFNLPVKFIKTIFSAEADFIKVIFADEADFIKVIFAKDAYFEEAKFEGVANFIQSTIKGFAILNNAKFEGVANFNETKFLGGAGFEDAYFEEVTYFNNTTFLYIANFNNVKFKGVANFTESTFDKEASFTKSFFLNDAVFYQVKFLDVIYFTQVIFEKKANFKQVSFELVSYFEETIFKGETNFKEAKFERETNFKEAKFEGITFFINTKFLNAAFFRVAGFSKEVYFNEAIFTKAAYFNNSIFEKEVHFDNTIFLNKFELDNAIFKENIIIANCFIQSVNIEFFKSDSFFIISNSCIKNLVIQNSIFQKINFNNVLSNSINDDLKKLFKKNEIEIKNESTENIEWNFSGQDLSNFSFIECDFSVANFLSANIQKTHIDNCIFPTDKIGRKKLFYHNTNEDEIKLQFTYQRFKRQFTENHYYQLAQDFHFQEMELRKKLSKNVFEKIVLKIYYFLSRYGTNYLRPFIYLLIWVFIYPIILLYKTWEINLFCNTWDYDLYGQTFSALFKLLAPFKLIHGNDDDFLNIYNIYINTGFGIFLVVFFYIVVTILITMFLQALSRNFKR